MVRKLMTLVLALQFANGKISMIFSGLTFATVMSMKFHVPFLYTVCVCVFLVLIFAGIIIKTGWMQKEYGRINQLNGIMEKLDIIDKKLNSR